MEAYQERAIEESRELEKKTGALNMLINTVPYYHLSDENRLLLAQQVNWMQGYLDTLNARIALFGE